MPDQPEITTRGTGVVLFFDVDAYLKIASAWNMVEESQRLTEWRGQIIKTATKHDFHLARSFGDGFLLYSHRKIDTKLAKNTLNFLREIGSYFKEMDISIRGAFASGLFEVNYFPNTAENNETVLVGPIANFAGKLLANAPTGEFIGAWQIQSNAELDISYSTLSSDEDRFKFWRFPYVIAKNLKINELEEVANPLKKAENQSSIVEGQMYFSEQIKMFILETGKIADDKAKAAFGVAAALLVFLFNFNRSGFFISNKSINWSFSWSFMIELGSLLFLGLTCIFAFMTFVPRQTTRFPRGLAFYGSIAEWGNAASYLSAVNAHDTEALADELTAHNFEISRVSKSKFYWLKYSLWSLGVGISLMFLRFFLLRLDL